MLATTVPRNPFLQGQSYTTVVPMLSTDSLPVQQGQMARLNRPLGLLPISEESLDVAKEIRSGKPVHDRQAISAAVKWMEPLTSAWMGGGESFSKGCFKRGHAG